MRSEQVIDAGGGAWDMSSGSRDGGLKKSIYLQYGKRVVSLVGAFSLIALLAPVFMAIVAGVLLSGRPVFFSHERVGWNRKKFKCFKFRTMRPDADRVLAEVLASDPVAREEWTQDFKLRNDPRVTRFGRFLRQTSLDELPQLFNVLRGDMSLVGPRPIVADELPRYGRYAHYYLSVRPGMTGLWQVNGRNNTTYRRRIVLDCKYVKHRSWLLDLKILMKTTLVVLGRGAY